MPDTLPFRQQILRNAFYAIQEGDYAYVSIRPQFEAMYPFEQRTLYGHVSMILDPNEATTLITGRIIQVRTILGYWSFKDNGLSLAGQATLSIRSTEPGELLCLHSERDFEDPQRLVPIIPVSAELLADLHHNID